MKSEKEKMLSGELYNAGDKQLADERAKTRLLLKELNDSREDQSGQRESILKQLLPNAGIGLWLQPPFYCDYGTNIVLGENVFFNFNCVLLDVSKITVGSRTLFGPNVQIYTATHPINYLERSAGLEYGKAILIGEDVWVGGSAIICPGVKIGNRSIIGAGSVVTKDIPGDVMAAGNPCRIIKGLKEQL